MKTNEETPVPDDLPDAKEADRKACLAAAALKLSADRDQPATCGCHEQAPCPNAGAPPRPVDTEDDNPSNMLLRAGYLSGLAPRGHGLTVDDKEMLLQAARSLMHAAKVMTGSQLWWLSFVDRSRPEGDQFLGATVAGGVDLVEAARAAWANGSNPGGEVLGAPVPGELTNYFAECVGRLMTRAECVALDERVARERGVRGG